MDKTDRWIKVANKTGLDQFQGLCKVSRFSSLDGKVKIIVGNKSSRDKLEK